MQQPFNQFPNNAGEYNVVPPVQNGNYTPPYNPYINMSPQAREQMQKNAYYQAKRKKERNEIITLGLVIGAVIVAYLVIQILAVSALGMLGLKDVYASSSVFQNCFNVIAVHLLSIVVPFAIMSLILKKKYDGPVIPMEKNGAVKTFMWVAFGMGGCLVANIVTSYVIALFKAFGYELTQSELADPDSVFACVAVVVSTAIIPAVCEEFAMRCCTLGVLKKHGKAFGVLAVSVVFGLLHGNVIQFVFAFLVGLVLGYITIRTNSVLAAVLVHFFNNGLSVANDIIKFASTQKIAEYTVSAVYIIWAVLAVIAVVYFVAKKELLPPKQEYTQREPYALSLGAKLACLIPGFFIPFVILIVMSVTTIVKI